MSEISSVQYAKIKYQITSLPDIDPSTVTRWVGVSDKCRPNTKRPCYLRVKTVSIRNMVLMCKDGAIVVRPYVLNQIKNRMTKSILGAIGLSFIARNVETPGTSGLKASVLSLDEFETLKRLMTEATRRMRFDDGLPKPQMKLDDAVDAIRYANEGRYGWNAEVKDKSNYLVSGGSVS